MTLKLFKSGIHSTMGVAAVVAIVMASGVLDSDNQPAAGQADVKKDVASKRSPAPIIPTKLPQAAVDSKLSTTSPFPPAAVPAVAGKKDNATAETGRPKFDVLRVEKDGSVVVAGNAVPNSQVDIVRPDGTIVGQAQTGVQGDFALALKDILSPGNHVLGLRSTDEDGAKLRSAQTGIVRIPKADGDVLAMVTQHGEVSRILMKPVAFEAQDEPILKRESLAATSPTEKKELPKADNSLNTNKNISTAKHPVLVEAVEVEGQRVSIAGAVMKGELVRVYLDNVAMGTARGTSDNRFVLSKKFQLKPGMHAVRVDVINEKTGGVWSRAEVGLQHDLPEEVLVVETNKSANFANNSADEKNRVEVASLDLKLRQSVIDEEVMQRSPLGVPTNPLRSNGSGALSDEESKRKSNKLEYAHTIKSAVSESTDNQNPEGFIYTGRAIIIKPGDSLWRISQHTYGDGMRYTTIFNANRNQIRDPNLIYAGQIFKIPEKVVQ